MKCIWCSGEVAKLGSKRLPHYTQFWKAGSMHPECYREWIDLHWFNVPQATHPDGKYDYWYISRKNYKSVADAFNWLEATT